MTPTTFVMSGMVAGVPGHGGATWAVLQYLLGLRRLGHEVLLIEPVSLPPGDSLADSPAATYCAEVMRAAGLDGAWALLRTGSTETAGLAYDDLLRRVGGVDVLLNVSGMLTDEALTERIPVRVYLDLDPAFNQLWHDVEGIDMRFDGHTDFVTVGLSIGTDRSPVPTCGRSWITTLPPVVLDEWPVACGLRHRALTTVANFRGYGSITHDGVLYGQKAHSLRPLLELPERTGEALVLALAIHPGEVNDLESLRSHGWQLVDPRTVTGSPAEYRRFVQGSWAEFGLAKSGYVVSRSGWFSDRSACYLASGRPVVAQDTGFPAHVPTGEGLLSFTTVDDVVTAVEGLRQDYERHRRAARALAEAHFDSDRVLGRLLDRLGGS